MKKEDLSVAVFDSGLGGLTVVKELRKRQAFNKPSEVKRERKNHAIYVQQLHQNED